MKNMFELFFSKIATIMLSIGLDKLGNLINDHISKDKSISIEEMKRGLRVLFVDDDDFDVKISVIKEAGWNVSQIKDINNLDSHEIVNADIIFMDYIGVGKILTPKDQGIGLLKAIKKKYPDKFIIFFSGYAGYVPGHEVHSIADEWIDKHADSFVYIDHIEEGAKKIYEKR